MYQTQLFNIMARYSDDTCSNPVANLVLRHGCALQLSDKAQDEFRHLMDVLMSEDIRIMSNDKHVHMEFPGQSIIITPDKQVYLNGVLLSCICESYSGLVSFVSSGEVITILPIKLLEG